MTIFIFKMDIINLFIFFISWFIFIINIQFNNFIFLL